LPKRAAEAERLNSDFDGHEEEDGGQRSEVRECVGNR
jgi:hypothetical protein